MHWADADLALLAVGFRDPQPHVARYGKNHLAEDCTSQDWGVTYDELEPTTTGSSSCTASAARRET